MKNSNLVYIYAGLIALGRGFHIRTADGMKRQVVVNETSQGWWIFIDGYERYYTRNLRQGVEAIISLM